MDSRGILRGDVETGEALVQLRAVVSSWAGTPISCIFGRPLPELVGELGEHERHARLS